ncbi:hypothetical protein NECAME_11744 [Necator americanus]|uniref:Uncharacterized protein n=1 Tax=Necator americanus TaxID=51031 RepID=W2T5W9_NECAM|nr:hypothetical protein NECAME_11744 [Necator americanus]ETN76362.1 hypothetical protein NECAME_11744 [Necator americanus]
MWTSGTPDQIWKSRKLELETNTDRAKRTNAPPKHFSKVQNLPFNRQKKKQKREHLGAFEVPFNHIRVSLNYTKTTEDNKEKRIHDDLYAMNSKTSCR